MKNKQSLAILLLFSFFFLGSTESITGKGGESKPHPTLVNLESSNCTTCHENITDKKFVHSLLKESGCDSCHEMNKQDSKVTVGLMEEGNGLCFVCHSGIKEKSSKEYPHAAVEEGCSTCHHPHSSDNSNLLVAGMEELCGTCHDIQEEEFKKTHGRQPVPRVGCGACHDSHGSDEAKLIRGKFKHVPFKQGECTACHKRPRGKNIRLRGEGAKLCYACHGDKEKEFNSFSGHSLHPPIKKGECSGCHDPHMSNHKSLLKGEGKELCFRCHEDISNILKSKNIHPPVEESCQDCHSAHGSQNSSLLVEKEVTLCLNCHDTDDETYKSKHYSQKPEDLKCSECHNPHGSNGSTLMNTFGHPPFTEKECDSCHEDVGEDKKIKLASENVSELCLTCHDDKAVDESNKEVTPHGALEADSCTACHSAHASSRQHIIKDHTARLCATCHEERQEEKKRGFFIHDIIDSLGCQACHESHFSKNQGLLIEKPNRLCLACHLATSSKGAGAKDQEVTLFGKIKLKKSSLESIKKIMLSPDFSRGHPQIGHPVSGTISPEKIKNKRLRGLTFKGELSCLSCHDPHAGISPQLFINQIPGRFQLCLFCHKK